MHALTRILELLVTNRKLSSAKPHVLNALAGLAVVICLGVFATVLAALILSAVLWLGYAQMLALGAQIATAGLVIGGFAAVVFVVTISIALRIWQAVRAEVVQVFDTQTPLKPVTNVANAFVDGILKAGQARRTKRN